MFLYFFDLDDTISNTAKAVKTILDSNPLLVKDGGSTFIPAVEEALNKYGVHNYELLNTPALALLKKLLSVNNENAVYYITARKDDCREDTLKWLRNHNLWIGDDKLIMNTEGIKGKIINEILLQNNNANFAFLFDDLLDNHREALKYPNIIPCLPNLININGYE